MNQPLGGRTALVAASEGRVGTVARSLRELGARVISFPTVGIEPVADSTALDDAVRGWAAYDWVVFTSTNGVEAIASRARALGVVLGSRPPRIAVVGPATKTAAEAAGLPVDAMPKEFLTDRIAVALGPVRGRRVLLARSNLARPSLAKRLRQNGATVDVVDAYRTVPRTGNVPRIPRASKVDFVVFTSASAVRNLVAALPSDVTRRLRRSAAVVCIGPITAAAARDVGFRVAMTAREHSVPGLVRALREGDLDG